MEHTYARYVIAADRDTVADSVGLGARHAVVVAAVAGGAAVRGARAASVLWELLAWMVRERRNRDVGMGPHLLVHDGWRGPWRFRRVGRGADDSDGEEGDEVSELHFDCSSGRFGLLSLSYISN
jgi:hypothetical protein